MTKVRKVSLDQYFEIPSEFEVLSKPKLNISEAIVEASKEKNISIRNLAKNIGMKHPQIVKVTSGDANYTIETLLKILHGLDLEINIVKKR